MTPWQIKTLPWGIAFTALQVLNVACVAYAWRNASDFKRAIHAGIQAANTFLLLAGWMIWFFKK